MSPISSPLFTTWLNGYGAISHRSSTVESVSQLLPQLVEQGNIPSIDAGLEILIAADHLASAGMWLTVHMTYAKHVYLDGRPLQANDFKIDPQGHTGGALNMVPAYTAYLALNALTGITRGWLMGQGHCVAAIDACNLLVNNLSEEHARRYHLSDEGLSRFTQDFYSYAVGSDGKPSSPLGSHVNVHTAGGISEGGYLGFAELQYVHMPLPGERLVAFLSDGAFEEQRGSDWAPRWWRAEDSGFVAPVMIANGRRIEQRATLEQQGGIPWFSEHLRHHGFDPIVIDGHDPAAYICALWKAEQRQQAALDAIKNDQSPYPVAMHYIIAECEKGFGFSGAGSNRAHNLPLGDNPSQHESARQLFNNDAKKLFVPFDVLQSAQTTLNTHKKQQRVRERDHALTRRHVDAINPVIPAWKNVGERVSPMAALDTLFCDIADANPNHRLRIGNPDELASNRMVKTLGRFKHRVSNPEPFNAEAVDGNIITALNEEAVACAALANKGGINLVVSYEAFAVKMLGAMRQEIIFARHQKEAFQQPQWLSVPFLLTSHTWENGKNEQSHQDPTLCEVLLSEMNDTSVVRFPADANSAMVCLHDAYQRRGELHTLVVPKGDLPVFLSGAQSQQLLQDGAIRLAGQSASPLQLIAVGAYQLVEAHKAWQRLQECGYAAELIVLLEPGRFRQPRDVEEASVMASAAVIQDLFGHSQAARIILTHTRPEALIGALQPLNQGRLQVLGYHNRGGTLNVAGMLYANRCSWIHALAACADALAVPRSALLHTAELDVLEGEGDVLRAINQA
jgi:phosphoketolase